MINFPAKIDKEIIKDLPSCNIAGEIVIVDKLHDVAPALKELKKAEYVGFDTETKPTFKAGQQNKISLLQLATTEKAYLFRLNMIGECSAIKRYLESDKYTKIGLSVKDDFHALQDWMPCKPNNFIEIQKLVQFFGIEEMSLRKIYAIIFGKKISKRERLSNWEAPTLSPEQIKYAATDAWVCIEIYNYLYNMINEVSNAPISPSQYTVFSKKKI